MQSWHSSGDLKQRILAKTGLGILLAWCVFISFYSLTSYTHRNQSFEASGERAHQRLMQIKREQGKRLQRLAQEIGHSTFIESVSQPGEDVFAFYSVPNSERIDRAWYQLARRQNALQMSHYDAQHTQLGHWAETGRTEQADIISEAFLERAFAEHGEAHTIHCADRCILLIAAPAHPENVNHGVLVLSLPFDQILSQFKAEQSSQVAVLQAPPATTVAGNEQATPSVIAASHSGVAQRVNKILHNERNVPTFSLQKTQNAVTVYVHAQDHWNESLSYLLAEDVTAQVYQHRRTLIIVALVSFGLAMALLWWLRTSLGGLLSKIRPLIQAMPHIEQGEFQQADKLIEHLRTSPKDGDLNTLHVSTRGVSQQLQQLQADTHQQSEALERLTDFDEMTGVYNRRSFLQKLAALHQKKVPFYLLSLDLDNLKVVNDSLGQERGDRVITHFATTLFDNAPEEALVGRIDGDEFAMVMPKSTKPEAYEMVAAITKSMNELNQNTAHFAGISSTPSIGAVRYPEDSLDLEQIIAFADAAMVENKRSKKAPISFYNGEERNLTEKKKVAQAVQIITQALNKQLIMPHLQPIVVAKTGAPVAFEVLARIWDEGQQRFIMPAEFVPYAEKSQLIVSIDKYMLTHTLVDYHRLRPRDRVLLSINISVMTLRSVGIVRFITKTLREYQFDPSRLILEVTESATYHEDLIIRENIARLRVHGVKIALDDFGAGYSTFNLLNRFEIDYLKIDKSITQGLLNRKSMKVNKIIAKSIVQLAKQLQLKVIAEGVEDEKLRHYLVRLEVDYLQGYYFGYPVPLRESAPTAVRTG